MDVIFVCTGNTCRSPMAEGIFRQLYPQIDVTSMGVSVSVPSKANPLAIEVCRTHGIDISSHIASAFDHKRVTDETMVLTMTESHKQAVKRNYPIDPTKVMTLKEFVNQKGDVPDPYGFERDVYLECFQELYALIKHMNITEE